MDFGCSNISTWAQNNVATWLEGLKDEFDWFDKDLLIENKICGEKLLLLSPSDLKDLGIHKVNSQEIFIDCVEKLREKFERCANETLQNQVFRLGLDTRNLQIKLARYRMKKTNTDTKTIELVKNFEVYKQSVALDTLSDVSDIITLLTTIVEALNICPFSRYCQYRSMRSLFLALGIELSTTAQRDQSFVDQPNDLIEKCCKSFADYCDTVLHAKIDPLFVQLPSFETIIMKRKSLKDMWDFQLNLRQDFSILCIADAKTDGEEIKTLQTGDELIQINGQTIIGWTADNVEKLLLKEIIVALRIKKAPRDY